jgi:multiple sugar transport system substrate-binding protein
MIAGRANMTEVKFSIYGDRPSPLEEPEFWQEFRAQSSSTVQVERLAWTTAWPRLLNYALYGGGPHLSQIGSLWTSTLVSMNTLRPFTAHEVATLGGADAFFASTWQSTRLPGSSEVWGIPFTGFTYSLFYRRDLLRDAGIAEETAFASAAALSETLQCLQARGVSSPWVIPSGQPYRARVHIAASWIWGVGGDFVSDDGLAALFDQPAARAGLKAFFDLYRYLSPGDYNLNYNECIQRFARGESAVLIGNAAAPALIQREQGRQVMDNLGVVAVPGVPWIGGSDLVVWRDAQMYPDRERAALLLVKYLTSLPVQIKYAIASNALPARSEAVEHMTFELPTMREVFAHNFRAGRSYKPVPIWVRMLNALSPAFDAITAELLADKAGDIDRLLTKHLTPLAERFNLMLDLSRHSFHV